MQNADANSSQLKSKLINTKINRFIYIYTQFKINENFCRRAKT